MEYKIGQELPITDPEVLALSGATIALKAMVDVVEDLYKANHTAMWSRIYNLFPGSKNYKMSYNHAKNTVLIEEKKETEHGK